MSRHPIRVGDRAGWIVVKAMGNSARALHHPATHQAVCTGIGTVPKDHVLAVGDRSFQVLKSWDEAKRRRPVTEEDRRFYNSQAGKFTHMHLVEITGAVPAAE
ncbi:hypothetical protein [Microbaculum marinum]|uniref:Uncharacterized protein n=1 Tax=Microbaculum marinum TaxID=1764581 RepID=A0AAW9RPB4_9HYPH